MFETRCCRHQHLFRHQAARSNTCRISVERRSVLFRALKKTWQLQYPCKEQAY